MATAEEELTQRLMEHFEVVKFAREVMGVMASSDLQHETQKSVDTVNKIGSKITKAKEGAHTSIRGKY